MFIHLILIELEQWSVTNVSFIWPASGVARIFI
jgi:hypothetical protein